MTEKRGGLFIRKNLEKLERESICLKVKQTREARGEKKMREARHCAAMEEKKLFLLREHKVKFNLGRRRRSSLPRKGEKRRWAKSP